MIAPAITQDMDAVPGMSRVLVVEDHQLLGEILVYALGRSGFEASMARRGSAWEVLQDARRQRPHVVVLGLRSDAAAPGVALIRPLVHLGAAVLVVSGSADRLEMARCLELGAVGVMAKADPLTELLTRVGRAARGATVMPRAEHDRLRAELLAHRRAERARRAAFEALTPRECELLAMIVDGRPAADIAQRCVVSLSTVRTHVRAILQKLGVNSQMAAAALARSVGWHAPTRETPQLRLVEGGR